ncbi:LOW QUALITY PROTEIN: reverse transcriptase [Phytophthora megakarya]|uniref:Reverse transcriptase n=1 Tax=Phytophthora megakarya TaxID=4795 RepID=A0A225UTW0_9STRA|nr:LOW QUALITY PROTEIN: reverse transcriptase [Phytophthora megakarya]
MSGNHLTVEILRSVKGEEEILGALAASITPRVYIDAALEEITPRKRSSRTARSQFRRSDRPKACTAVIWKLPNWDVVRAASGYVEGLTVNEAEYRGKLLGISLLDDLDVARLIVCGDSNMVIRQMRGEIDCKSPGLKLLRAQAWNALRGWPRHEFLHIKRDWNASADMLAGQALQRQQDNNSYNVGELEDLRILNRLGEVVRLTTHDAVGGDHVLKAETRGLDDLVLEAKTRDLDDAGRGTKKVCPVITRSRDAANPAPSRPPEVLKELEVLDRVCTAQEEEAWIANLKKFLGKDISGLSRREAKNCAKIAERYEVRESGLLYYHVRGSETAENRDTIMKLVVPETLREDVLHHYHASLEGEHQVIGRTYQRIRRHFHWPGCSRACSATLGNASTVRREKAVPQSGGSRRAT